MMKYNIDVFGVIVDELKELLEDNHKEVDMYQDKVKLNPDYELYYRAEGTGHLVVFSMRDEEDKLCGYNLFFIVNNPHYKDHDYATNDVLYIDPEYRHTEHTPNFINYCEDMLKKEGVSVITYNMKVTHPFHGLMKACDYDHAEIMYTKYVGQ